MAQAGQVLRNREGERLIFRRTAADTNGEFLELDVTYTPNSPPPPAHYHPYQEEQFEIVRGRFRVIQGGEETEYGPGDRFTVPANTVHMMHNIADEEGQLRWQVRPALRTEELFTTLWSLAQTGDTDESGVPSLPQIAVIFRAHSREFRLAKPPYPLQWLVFTLLAPIGRLRGYRAYYDDALGDGPA